MEITNEALAQLLFAWLSDIDSRNDLDWYVHVAEKNFECGCHLEYYYEDGIGSEYCAYWSRGRHRIVDVSEAEWQAHEEKALRFVADWAEAINHHRVFCANEALYKNLRLVGERYDDFMERITP